MNHKKLLAKTGFIQGLFLLLLTLFSIAAQAAVTFSVSSPNPNLTGAYTVTWSGGQTFVQLYIDGALKGQYGPSGTYSGNDSSGTHSVRFDDCSQRTNTPTCTTTSTQQFVLTVPAPTVSASFVPSQIAAGQSATLSWSPTGATSCSFSPTSRTSVVSGTTVVYSSILSTFTATVTCTGMGGTSSTSATVTVVPKPTVTASFNVAQIASGASPILTWSSTNASSCSGLPSGTAPNGSYTYSGMTSSTAVTVTCTGVGGSTAASATVTVVPIPTVSVSFNVTQIASGASPILTWSSTNASSCSGLPSGTAPSGSYTYSGMTSSTIVSVTCTGVGGSTTASATVTVVPKPTVSVSFNPTPVTSGGSANLTWSSTNASSCAGLPSGTAPSGSYTYSVVNSPITVSVTCTGVGGSTTTSATLGIVPAAPASISVTVNLSSMFVKWAPSAIATKYNLNRNGALIASNLTALYYVDLTVVTGTSYSYSINACNATGCSTTWTTSTSSANVAGALQTGNMVGQQYEYDALGRLKKVKVGGADKTNYQYDKAGNRTTVTEQ